MSLLERGVQGLCLVTVLFLEVADLAGQGLDDRVVAVGVAGRDRLRAGLGAQVLDPGAEVRVSVKVRRSPVAVIDAKYKAEKPAGYPNADLYQLLAYCTVLGLHSGHLVYAKGNEKPVRHVVRRSGIEIFCHAVDLDQPPGELLVQMSDLAERIAATRLQPWAKSLSVSSRVTR